MTDLDDLIGSIVTPDTIPDLPRVKLERTKERLETGLKVLDAVLPIQRGGTVDLRGPAGLGQLVLVAEIAAHLNAVVVAVGSDPAFHNLVEDDDLEVRVVVIEGDLVVATAAASRVAETFAGAGETVLLVLDAEAWEAAVPPSGATSGGGSVTAFRFASHPRDADPTPAFAAATTSLVYSTRNFVEGLHPAIDVVASRSELIDAEALDAVSVGTARVAREVLRQGEEVRSFLAQPLIVAQPFTGVPGEDVPARTAIERLAELVR